MFRECPSCGSTNVRRSSFHGAGVLTTYAIFSPYRCRECRTHFRVVSKKFYGYVGVIGLAMLPPLLVYLIYAAFS